MKKRKILVDRSQVLNGLVQLKVDNYQVDIRDVVGVLQCCDTYLTNREQTTIVKIPDAAEVANAH